MNIGIPKEIKNNENRVSVVPSGVELLRKNNHSVFVETKAGIGSGFSDEEYKKAGATILPNADEVFKNAEMIIKVKEPIDSEYKKIQKGQLLFTYFHFASSKNLLNAMIEREAVCIAYETVEASDKSLPLLVPMSEIAGRMAAQQGAKYLEKPFGGRGVLLGGVPGVLPGNVVILGGGIVGTEAAKMAAGLGANVTILDISLQRLRVLSDILPDNVKTMFSNEYNIRGQIRSADLIIGAVLVPGGKAPKLITKSMLKEMKTGTVLVDVAVDQGGCIETCQPTTHENPTFIIDEVLHYCVANMPGAVPHTSTLSLTNATLPYALQIANKGWKKACKENTELQKGLNLIGKEIVYPPVANAFNLKASNKSVEHFLS